MNQTKLEALMSCGAIENIISPTKVSIETTHLNCKNYSLWLSLRELRDIDALIGHIKRVTIERVKQRHWRIHEENYYRSDDGVNSEKIHIYDGLTTTTVESWVDACIHVGGSR